MTSDRNGPEADAEQKDLMDPVKGSGPWQWWIFAMLFVCQIPDGSSNMAMTFLAPNLEYWCARPPYSNISVQEWKEIALPPGDSKCSRYRFINISLNSDEQFRNSSSSNETIACNSWEFDDSFYVSTIVSQWNLVCDREWLISMSKSVYIIGYIISSSVFAYLADRIGRKPVTIVCNVLAIVSGVCTIFSTSFLMFAISRVFTAAGVTGAANTGNILMMEIVTPKYRSPYFVGFNVAWSSGALLLPLIAWWLRDWVWMETLIILPSLLFLLCCWWLPESPRWLAHGKPDKAVQVLSKAAKMNRVRISDVKLEEMVSQIEESCEGRTPTVSVMQLFHPELRLRTLVVWFIWSATAFVYYGIAYNTNELVGDPFVNFTLYHTIEISACIPALVTIECKGRRRPLALSLLCAALACLLVYPIPQDPWWMRACVSLFGYFCISSTFFIINLFTFEIFPTLLRNIGFGSASTVARFAVILAPFVRELERTSHPVIPQVIFGVVSLISAGLALLLPETTHCSVPDTLREAADIDRKNNKHILKGQS